MKTMSCEYVRDIAPELLAQRVDAKTDAAVRAHLQSCADCHAELAVASAVVSARLAVPAGLDRRIESALRGRVPARRHWPIAAAAAVVVAMLGGSALIHSVLDRAQNTGEGAAVTEGQGAGWFSVDDAFMSGASSLRDLSVEELEKLLVELDS
jgi:hypothetical protein